MGINIVDIFKIIYDEMFKGGYGGCYFVLCIVVVLIDGMLKDINRIREEVYNL